MTTAELRFPSPTPPRATVRREPFVAAPGRTMIDAYVLRNVRGVEARVLAFGGTLVSLRVPDRDGRFDDVVLGHDTVEDYAQDDRYFGALIGRYANRIAGARFTLDGETHELTRNEGDHQLHGGPGGFHHLWWGVEPFVRPDGVGVTLRHTSPHGAEGFPGTLRVRVTYTLSDDDALAVDYHAITDRATPVSLTHHSYFNLAGHDAGDALGHELTLAASEFLPVDDSLVPTGELCAVQGTPFDFTAPCAIGARLGDGHDQLRIGNGYDHCFALDARQMTGSAPSFAARLCEPTSGRVLELFTTEPALQLYAGGGLHAGTPGKGGAEYRRHAGIALEPQRFPDAPNQPRFPSAILRPGEAYTSRTVYRFSVEPRA